MTLTIAAVGGGPVTAAPDAVTGLTASPLNAGARVSWTAPATGTGTPTGVTVTATAGSIVRSYSLAAGTTSFDAAQLINGMAWTVSVVVRTSVGNSPAATTTVTPTAASPAPVSPRQPTATVPGAPVLVSATSANGAAVASWSAPVDNGGADLTAYLVAALGPAGTVSVSVGPDTLTATVAPLANGTAYSIRVTAYNAAGAGTVSNALTVTPVDTAPEVDVPPVTPPVTPGTPTIPGEAEPAGAPGEPVLDAFPVSYPLAPAFFLATPEEAAAILVEQSLNLEASQ